MTNSKEPKFFLFMDRFLDRGPRTHIFILVVLGFLAHINVVGYPFVHDDVVFIQQNPNISRWDNLADAFFRPAIPTFVQGMVTPYYRPVLEFFYRLQYLVFGLNPHGFHFFNIVIHILNGLLLYALLNRLFNKPLTAIALAAIFLVHPVQTEAVACVSGISNLACTLFMLMSFYAYIRCADENGRKFFLGLFGSGVCFLAALLTKEQAVVLPVICVMYDVTFRNTKPWPRLISRWLTLALVLSVYLTARHALFGGFTTAIFENMGELKLRMFALARLLEMYGSLFIFPSGLHYYRSLDILSSNGMSWLILGVLGVLVLLFLRGLEVQERRKAVFSIAWFIIALGPVLNIIPLVNEYSFVAAAEHNLYFPAIGLLICAGVFVSHLQTQFIFLSDALVKKCVVVLVMFLILASLAQNQYWRGEIPLFQRASAYEPQLGRVHILLAKAYFKEGQLDNAIKEYSRAEEIMQGYIQKAASKKAVRFYQGMLKGILSDSAQAYAHTNQLDQSIAFYDRAVALDPLDSYLYSNRALSFIAKGDLQSGILDLEKALLLNPDNLLAANNLSICFIQKGELANAKTLLEKILSKDPGFSAARDNLNKLLKAQQSIP